MGFSAVALGPEHPSWTHEKRSSHLTLFFMSSYYETVKTKAPEILCMHFVVSILIAESVVVVLNNVEAFGLCSSSSCLIIDLQTIEISP